MNFCWQLKDAEGAPHGPFDTLAECKQDIVEYFPEDCPTPPGKILICQANEISPGEWADVFDANEVLERMEEALCDDGTYLDDIVFFIPDEKKEEAKAKLGELLLEWVSTYVQTSGEWTAVDAVLVTTLSEIVKESRPE